MFSLFKILFLLASFLPLIFADCTSGVINDVNIIPPMILVQNLVVIPRILKMVI